ncbi:MAG: M20/M25/M40 family metallo-hydrolase [Candidatus Korarchaeota archaeon]|nr:M20/M25/M40 family metallo-hydrolase [Thermoproteota archaeon]MCR8463181.1 M20/M25/M40 family metallo-hydrolase [Thermoproteota archaeon]MCR8470574.1 M20/M25/M40 family metallo-hydrolase [Thermoproteota archaeon]MCR8472226.1 M20/M25/M40 family metallo-hydrolase [Thermoproteota archaeon]MCR8473099.1 M20/M25/M40 family metallo-hydrolase [Thermoproteota archaeon]
MISKFKEIYEVELLDRLIRIKSIIGRGDDYKKIAGVIEEELRKLGLKVNVFDGSVEAKDGIPRPCIVGVLDSGSEKTFGVLTHYDVVDIGGAWRYEPFELTVVEEGGEIRLYGRGAADDKGCIVASIGAIKEMIEKDLEPKWNVALIITPDEEIGGEFGAGYIARNRLVDLDALLVADSSSKSLVVGASGIVHGDIVVKGIQGHAGYIFGTENAVHKAITLLNEMLNFTTIRSQKLSRVKTSECPIPRLWGRFSITKVNTPNQAYNIVPDEVVIGFDMRLIPEENVEDALVELKAFFEMVKYRTGIYDAHLRILRAFPGWMTAEEHPFVRRSHEILEEVTNKSLPITGMLGGNDGGWFKDFKIPIISFGVWDEKSRIHGVDESVSLARIFDLKKFIIKLALSEVEF